MIKKILKFPARLFRFLRTAIYFYCTINWFKTIFFNFKMLPFKQAKKLPIVFYGKVTFTSLKGKIVFEVEPEFGMVGFGQRYEMTKTSMRNAQLEINGNFVVKGHIQFGPDYIVVITKSGNLEMGNFSSLGCRGKIFCTNKIVFGTHSRIGFESQVMDTNFHDLINTETGEVYPTLKTVVLGDYNFVGNRVSIMGGTKTPKNSIIASSSLCNKDFSLEGANILIGGIPSKLIKRNITRNWNEGKKYRFQIFSV